MQGYGHIPAHSHTHRTELRIITWVMCQGAKQKQLSGESRVRSWSEISSTRAALSHVQWNKTGQGKDTAVERRRKKRKCWSKSGEKRWQRWGKRTDTDTTIADREQGESICLWLWLLAHTLIFPNNYVCLSNTLLCHCPIIFLWNGCDWCDRLSRRKAL